MAKGGMEGGGEVLRFPTEKVVTTLSQKIHLWQQKLQREATIANERVPYEPTLDEVKAFALELEKETKSADANAVIAMQSRLMRGDPAGGEQRTVGDFKKALLNLTERDTDIYCRALSLAFLQLKAADERDNQTGRE